MNRGLVAWSALMVGLAVDAGAQSLGSPPAPDGPAAVAHVPAAGRDGRPLKVCALRRHKAPLPAGLCLWWAALVPPSAQAELSRQKAAAEAATSAVRAQHGALQRRFQALQDEAARLRATLAESGTALARVRDGAMAAEQQHRQQRAEQDRALSQCRRDNADLALLGEELLTRYERKGWAQMLSENEPFVQAGRVQLENARAAYAEQIARARQRPQSGTPTH